MSESFSTDLVPVKDRLNAWLSYAKPICGDCRFHFPKGHSFFGSIDRRVVASSTLTRFASAPVSFSKFPALSADCGERDCIVITQLLGTRRYSQRGAIALLAPGDTTIIDAGYPWTSDCSGDCSRLYLRIPHWIFEQELRQKSIPTLPRVLGKQGLGATLSHLAGSLYNESEKMSVDEGAVAIEAYLKILAACLSRPAALSTQLERCAQLMPRIENYIDKNLGERALTPSSIATNAGISVRHLHRLFAAKGWTVAHWIRERRLERCRCDLADSRLSDSSVTDIAFRWGFSDSAHFSHSFRDEFGISPRHFRAKALGNFNASSERVVLKALSSPS